MLNHLEKKKKNWYDFNIRENKIVKGGRVWVGLKI